MERKLLIVALLAMLVLVFVALVCAEPTPAGAYNKPITPTPSDYVYIPLVANDFDPAVPTETPRPTPTSERPTPTSIPPSSPQ